MLSINQSHSRAVNDQFQHLDLDLDLDLHFTESIKYK